MSHKGPRRLLGGVVLAFAVAGSMGQGCGGSLFPPPVIVDPPVGVDFVNTTGYPVNPFMYADPSNQIAFIEDVVLPENIVDTGTIPPAGTVAIDLDCVIAGTIFLDTPEMLLSPTEAVLSLTAPFLQDGYEYVCGDLVTFTFYDDPTVGFFTEVDVNGVIISQAP